MPFYKDKTILDLIILKLLKYFSPGQIILATTKDDNKIAEIGKKYKINCFQGDELNVLKRFIDAADEFGVEKIIRVCSDNPFLLAGEVKKLYDLGQIEGVDNAYMSFEMEDHTPVIKSHLGIYAEYCTKAALNRVAKLTSDKLYLEHVTNFIYTHPESFVCEFLPADERIAGNKNLRLTIDTINDFSMASKMFADLCIDDNYDISLSQILEYLNDHPELTKLMTHEIERNSK